MTTVTISVEGLSLWIRRKEYWEVLFPKAVGKNEQHCPWLIVEPNGIGIDPVPKSLKDVTLTTEGLTAGATPDPFAPSWMLKMRASASSAAGAANPAQSPDVFASLRLPLQWLERTSARNIGPVSFNGEAYQLDYGTSMRLNADSTAALVLNAKGTYSGGSSTTLETNVPSILISIKNVTDSDRSINGGETKKRDHLMESDDLLSLCDMQVAVPRYFGPDLKGPRRSQNIVPQEGLENPYRLCPSAYCIECPDN